jgi:hypothetical protein
MFVVEILLLISQLIRRVYVCVYNQHEIEGKKYFKESKKKEAKEILQNELNIVTRFINARP